VESDSTAPVAVDAINAMPAAPVANFTPPAGNPGGAPINVAT